MKNRVLKSFILILLLTLVSGAVSAQRLEIRFNKEFSNDSLINKTLGAGGSFIIDGWHDNLDFQINFDYAGHGGDVNVYGISHKLTKFKAGVGALYTRPLGERLVLRIGGDVSYNNIHKVVTNHKDSVASSGISNVSHRAHYLGLGGMVQAQVKFGKIFRFGVGVNPEYLIPLAGKSSMPSVECDYKKGLFVLQLQVGLEIKLN
ncbi:MAG: hypothetical protein II894_04030 [Bacteroidales bacterium]|nr:hypothetical protein [Bacteroidales bacterium]